MKKYSILKAGFFFLIVGFLNSCTKDKYYYDGGVANPNYDGSMLQYLENNPQFDTIAKIVKMAGLEKEFTEDDLTFFAPKDYSIKISILALNDYLRTSGQDTIQSLEEISGAIWRRSMMAYMFRGANRMKDYYQLDLNQRTLYPGQNYSSYNGTISNIGVNYEDLVVGGGNNVIKYGGYRSIYFSFIPDYNNLNSWYSTEVVSHDIKPKNGVVHALSMQHLFAPFLFQRDVLASR